MNATAEAPAPVAVEPPPPPKFVMPKPVLGQTVLFYRDGTKDSKRPAAIGTVFEVGQSSLALIVHGAGVDTVLHIDDPKLKNPNIRMNGAWDYTGDALLLGRLAKQVEVLEKRVATLES